MRGLDEWEVHLVENFPAPAPVLYSRVMCRCCSGKTREVGPTGFQVGAGAMAVSSFRYLCDDCGVVTWRRNR